MMTDQTKTNGWARTASGGLSLVINGDTYEIRDNGKSKHLPRWFVYLNGSFIGSRKILDSAKKLVR